MLQLTALEQDMLDGKHGEAVALSMRIITELGRIRGAKKLVDVESVHIDGCIFYGQAGLDFAEKLVGLDAKVTIPTTVNVGSIDLLHPGLVLESTEREKWVADGARKIMAAYAEMGVKQTWTCAPYQADARPEFGSNIAWAESNAIVFANSVLGARTDRYGDFLDIAAAITGKAPFAGLHLDENRQGDVILDCTSLSERVLDLDITYPILGYIGGHIAGTSNPVYVGLPSDVSEDRLKALGAAAASSGGVALFHVVGRTPDAPTLDAVVKDATRIPTHIIDAEVLHQGRMELCTAQVGKLDAVSLGTPHASLDEIRELYEELVGGAPIADSVQFYINTGRTVLEQATEAGYVKPLESLNVKFIVDTCAYITSIFRPHTKLVMTNSGKVAHYAPGNMGVDIVLATLHECVESARKGIVEWDRNLFND
jgi:predicted aconitase